MLEMENSKSFIAPFGISKFDQEEQTEQELQSNGAGHAPLDVISFLVTRSLLEHNRSTLGQLIRIKLNASMFFEKILDSIENAEKKILFYSRKCYIGIEILLFALGRLINENRSDISIENTQRVRTIQLLSRLHYGAYQSGSKYRRYKVHNLITTFFIKNEEYLCQCIRNITRIFDTKDTLTTWTITMPLIGQLFTAVKQIDVDDVVKSCKDFIATSLLHCIQQRQAIYHVHKDQIALIFSAISDHSIMNTLLPEMRRSLLRHVSYAQPILKDVFEHCEHLSSVQIISQLFHPLQDNLLSKNEVEQRFAAETIGRMLGRYRNSETIIKSIVSLCDILKGNCKDVLVSGGTVTNQQRQSVLSAINETFEHSSLIDLDCCIKRILDSLLLLLPIYKTPITTSSLLYDNLLLLICKWTVYASENSDVQNKQLANLPNDLDKVGLDMNELSSKGRSCLMELIVCLNKVDRTILFNSKMFQSFRSATLRKPQSFAENFEFAVQSYCCVIDLQKENDKVITSVADRAKPLAQLIEQYIELKHRPVLSITFSSRCFHGSLSERHQAWLYLLSIICSSKLCSIDLTYCQEISRFGIQFKIHLLAVLIDILKSHPLLNYDNILKKCQRLLKCVAQWPIDKEIQDVSNPHRHNFVYNLLMACSLYFEHSPKSLSSSNAIRHLFSIPFALYDQLGNTHIKLLDDLKQTSNGFSPKTCSITIGILCNPNCFVSKQVVDRLISEISREITQSEYIFTDIYHARLLDGTDGILVDESVIDRLINLETRDSKHMKKQGKVYTFEEQMSDFSLRRELLKSDKWQSQLTEKQARFLQTHLQEEIKLRKTIKDIKFRYTHLIDCLKQMLTTNFHYVFAYYFKQLFKIIAVHTPSVVTSAPAFDLFNFICKKLYLSVEESICLLVGLCCTDSKELPPRIPEQLYTAITPASDTIRRLLMHSVAKYSHVSDESTILKSKQLTLISTPKLACMDPLIECVFKSNEFGSTERLMALDIIELWCSYTQCNPSDRYTASLMLDNILQLSKTEEKCSEIQLKLIDVSKKLYSICLMGVSHSPRVVNNPTAQEYGQDYTKAVADRNNVFNNDHFTNPNQTELNAIRSSVNALSRLDRPMTIHIFLLGTSPAAHVLSTLSLTIRTRIACIGKIFSFFESNDDIRSAARTIVEACNVKASEYLSTVVTYSLARSSFIASPAVKCLVHLISEGDVQLCTTVIDQFKTNCLNLMEKLKNKQDEGRYMLNNVKVEESNIVQDDDVKDPSLYQPAKCIHSIVSNCPGKYNSFELLTFLVDNVLSSENVKIPPDFLTAALEIVGQCSLGQDRSSIIQITEYLEQKLAKTSKDRHSERLKTSLLVLLGASVRCLHDDLEKVQTIVEQLVQSLKTQSEMVQEAVANSFSMLVPLLRDHAVALLDDLFCITHKGKIMSERRGAAYGIAGIIKGLGIISLMEFQILNRIESSIKDERDPERRIGGLLVTSALIRVVGWSFEVYLIHLVPHILVSLSDKSETVRAVAAHCAKNIMTSISSQCINITLPAILEALRSDKWRTKCGAANLLGSLSYCDPEQLSHTLPRVVPSLIDMINDAHMRVQTAGHEALEKISTVIKLNEIKCMSPMILRALENPDTEGTVFINTLHKRQLSFGIDPVALALLMPILMRGFNDRVLLTRRQCGDILFRITKQAMLKDIGPYIAEMENVLKQRIFDPVPEMREISSKILASTMQKDSVTATENLVRWLSEMIVSDKSNINRVGAAQCMCEVVILQDSNFVHNQMTIALDNINGNDQFAIHGYFTFCLFISKRAPHLFKPHLPVFIPNVLRALSNELEIVRDSAYLVGQSMIESYFDDCALVILPEIEEHLFVSDWHIRLSSLRLLSDLVFRIVGQTERVTDGSQSDRCYSLLCKSLGQSTVDRVLSELFVLCNDGITQIAQLSVHTWRVIISNATLLLNQILPVFLVCVFDRLACCPDPYICEMFAHSLGDIIRRLGPVSFERILKTTAEQLTCRNSQAREGSCAVLRETIGSCPKDTLIGHSDKVCDLFIKMLCDSDEMIRQAAADAFVQFDKVVGRLHTSEYFIPSYLETISDIVHSSSPEVPSDNDLACKQSKSTHESRQNVIDGFSQLLTSMGPSFVNNVLSALLRLKTIPMELMVTACDASGASGLKFIDHICSHCLQDVRKSDNKAANISQAARVIASVTDNGTTLGVIKQLAESSQANMGIQDQRKFDVDAVQLLTAYLSVCSCDRIDEMCSTIIRVSFRLCCYSYTEMNDVPFKTTSQLLLDVWNIGHDLLETFLKRLHTSHHEKALNVFDQSLRALKYSRPRVNRIPGFNLKGKGARSIMSFYKQMFSQKIEDDTLELIVSSILRFFQYVSIDILRLTALFLIGCIIRLLGEKRNDTIRCMMLSLLNEMLPMTGVQLKVFAPQLLSTFTRHLTMPNISISRQALSGFRQISSLKLPLDHIIRDIHSSLSQSLSIDDQQRVSLDITILNQVEDNRTDEQALIGEWLYATSYTIVLCISRVILLPTSSASLKNIQIEQLKDILDWLQIYYKNNIQQDSTKITFTANEASSTLTSIPLVERLNRTISALEMLSNPGILSDEGREQNVEDFLFKLLEESIEVPTDDHSTLQTLFTNLVVLVYCFPGLCVNNLHVVDKLMQLCERFVASVHSNVRFDEQQYRTKFEALRLIGFLLIAICLNVNSSSCNENLQVYLNKIRSIFLSILEDKENEKEKQLAVRFILQSITVGCPDPELRSNLIKIANTKIAQQMKIKRFCLNCLMVTLQYPDRFETLSKKYNLAADEDSAIVKSNERSDMLECDQYTLLKQEMGAYYQEFGVQSYTVYDDCSELIGWM